LQGLPALGAYCYSHRIFYVDKQTSIAAMAGVESYDRSGKLYKVLWEANAPYVFRGNTTILNYTTTMSLVWDFQNKHATANNDEPAAFDEAVPAQYQDVATLSTPGGLASVMKRRWLPAKFSSRRRIRSALRFRGQPSLEVGPFFFGRARPFEHAA